MVDIEAYTSSPKYLDIINWYSYVSINFCKIINFIFYKNKGFD